jgi:hypothetical protein
MLADVAVRMMLAAAEQAVARAAMADRGGVHACSHGQRHEARERRGARESATEAGECSRRPTMAGGARGEVGHRGGGGGVGGRDVLGFMLLG